jgi:hypothetical protein
MSNSEPRLALHFVLGTSEALQLTDSTCCALAGNAEEACSFSCILKHSNRDPMWEGLLSRIKFLQRFTKCTPHAASYPFLPRTQIFLHDSEQKLAEVQELG